MNRKVVTDGTSAFMLNENGIQKITLADGTSVTYLPTDRFKAIAYGNSTLYVADDYAVYDVDPSNGTPTLIGLLDGVTDIAVKDADELVVVQGASLIEYNLGTEARVYVRKDIN